MDLRMMKWPAAGSSSSLSPINRLHSTKNEFNGKEPWRYKQEIRSMMDEFLRLRQLLPYLYTMNYRGPCPGYSSDSAYVL